MRFEVIPAIDVADGRLATFAVDRPVSSGSFGGDPVAAARAYVDAGARWLHVVDLDGALSSEARNLDTVGAIGSLGAAVQASGGIRTGDDAQAALDAGARRVVLGSGMLVDEEGTLAVIDRFRDRIVVGIEVDHGRIRARGEATVDLGLAETLGWLVAGGAPAFLVTAVARVGTLAGTDLATVERVRRAGRPVIAAGGIATVDQLRTLRRAGAAGAIVGRAALEGGLDLGVALRIE